LNLSLAPSEWQKVVRAALGAGLDFGRSNMGAGRRVNVEFVSANPTGPMHVGHVRGAVVGDALSNLLAFAGWQVTREYYINDGGAQVDVLARSAYERYREAHGLEPEIREGLYPGDYLIPVGAALKDRFGDALLDKPEADPISTKAMGKRALKNLLLDMLMSVPSDKALALAEDQYKKANNMTERVGAIMAVSGQEGPVFEQLMQEKILRPLQMRGTNFSSLNAINPSGGAQSTANDYINFCSMLLNKGMFNGKRILSEASVQYLLQAHTTSPMIKYAPKVAEGYNYAAGSWVIQTDSNGNPSVLASPGLFGTWPMIDLCRNYAVVFFAKELMNEDRKEVYLNLKKKIDEQIAANCQ
jgi:hypothetical protein